LGGEGGGCCLCDWRGWEATIVIYLAHNPPFWGMVLGNLVVIIYILWNDIVCMALMFDLNFTSNQVNKSIREKGSWATMWNRLGNFPLTFHKWPCLTMNLNSLKNHKYRCYLHAIFAIAGHGMMGFQHGSKFVHQICGYYCF
jgi:hypothetical protein